MKTASLTAAFIILYCHSALAETFLVTSNLDSGLGSLREAIAASNTTTGVQTIAFAVSNSITVNSQLNISAPVVIEGGGTTVGSLGSTIFYFTTGSDGSLLRNFVIINAKNDNACGIYLASGGNTVCGCLIGTDWAGNTNVGNTNGIYITGNGNIIGGNSATTRNVISGSLGGGTPNSCGVCIYAYYTKICGNYIGTNSNGMSAIPNGYGIYAYSRGSSLIGGDYTQGEGNIVSGNRWAGIEFESTIGNTICGNIIGLNSVQTQPLSNGDGIYLEYYSRDNYVGLPALGKFNIIAGNDKGIDINGPAPATIQNNLIGININNTPIPQNAGIYLNNATNMLIGSLAGTPAARNIISGNVRGIDTWCGNSSGMSCSNTICGNYFGTDTTGARAVVTFPRLMYQS